MSGIALSIDGREVTVPRDSTILTAAKEAGVKIPTLCHLEELIPSSACRICVVEVEGARSLVWMAFHFREACANWLTNPAFDPVSHTAEYKACAVRIERL
jgi:NADH dehydrogenase/NADH:ubiquinone oxidoreductase subunit G